MHDIIVIGGGPAGLTAALYGQRSGKSVLIIEQTVFGGQITNSPKVENIPGFDSISGDEFADRFLDQVLGQGADVILEKAVGAEKTENGFRVELADGSTQEARALILATGTKHRVLGLEGEEELIGNGIGFCAVCDGDFYKDGTVCVIGGGNSAFTEANLLADIVKKLILLQDLPEFTAEQRLQEQLFAHTNVEAHAAAKVKGYVTENGKLTGVRYEEDGQEKTAVCDGIFLAVGLIPDNKAYAHLAELDRNGYFSSGESCMTSTPGVFAAGDCRTKKLRQVATACADGAVAAIAACSYLTD